MLLEGAHEAEDAQSDALMQGPFVQREQIKSSMGMPLRVGGRPVGVIFVNYRSYHRFTADELTNIELFANQAAVAIRNAQLYQSKERHAQALRAIQDTSAAVSAVLDLDALLPMVTERAADIFATPATSLMLWNKAETEMVIEAAHGLGEEYVQKQRITREMVDALCWRHHSRSVVACWAS
jgi:GAF domain-containing protein/phage tail protein X